MKLVYFPRKLKHPKESERNIVQRTGTAKEYDLFLRKSSVYKVEVFRKNIGLSYCSSDICWALGH